jgi:hypothetical protein
LSALGGFETGCHSVKWFLDCMDALLFQQPGDMVSCILNTWYVCCVVCLKLFVLGADLGCSIDVLEEEDMGLENEFDM